MYPQKKKVTLRRCTTYVVLTWSMISPFLARCRCSVMPATNPLKGWSAIACVCVFVLLIMETIPPFFLMRRVLHSFSVCRVLHFSVYFFVQLQPSRRG
ncbi:unnamed protein product [Ectocarpus sp. 12 AP-2014]